VDDEPELNALTDESVAPEKEFAPAKPKVTVGHPPLRTRQLQQQKAVESRIRKKLRKDKDLRHVFNENISLREQIATLTDRVAALEGSKG